MIAYLIAYYDSYVATASENIITRMTAMPNSIGEGISETIREPSGHDALSFPQLDSDL